MIRNVVAVSIFSIVAHSAIYAMSQNDYAQKWSSVAIENMKNYRIPASITLAQGILESGSGSSPLAVDGNNHFGIKCSNWDGERIYFDDDEKGECFRKYKSAADSYKDHSLFLTSRERYASLFLLPVTDYKGWAKGLKKAGYATHPQYAERLIKLIEDLSLYQYDKEGLEPVKATEILAQEATETEDEASRSTAVKKRKQNIYNTSNTLNSMAVDLAYLDVKKHVLKENKNDVKYIEVQKGDTYYKIAQEFGLVIRQLYKYNDFEAKKDLLEVGDIVYLEPKRLRAKEKNASFVAKSSMSVIEISQREGIKVSSLVKMNQFSSDQHIVQKGQKVLLR